jgi:hypothetical protein
LLNLEKLSKHNSHLDLVLISRELITLDLVSKSKSEPRNPLYKVEARVEEKKLKGLRNKRDETKRKQWYENKSHVFRKNKKLPFDS